MRLENTRRFVSIGAAFKYRGSAYLSYKSSSSHGSKLALKIVIVPTTLICNLNHSVVLCVVLCIVLCSIPWVTECLRCPVQTDDREVLE